MGGKEVGEPRGRPRASMGMGRGGRMVRVSRIIVLTGLTCHAQRPSRLADLCAAE